jgi:anaerobic selenocysteine-containing dehydrogenase
LRLRGWQRHGASLLDSPELVEGAAVSTPAQVWQRISWDEALDEIALHFRSIVDEFGSEAILPYSYGGTLGALNGGSMDRRFFGRLGASELERTICSSAGEAGIESVMGVKLGIEPEQFIHSRYIIAWASNIHGNNVHLWPFIVEAWRRGAKLVVIDPYRTRTAECADWYLPINPGTDGALALAMMHVITNFNGLRSMTDDHSKTNGSGADDDSQLPFLPFAHGNFRTPSGKAELYSEAMKALGLDPVAEFKPPAESRHGAQSSMFPLEFLARKADNFLNSTFSNVSSVRQMEDADLLQIHSSDAEARGIADEETVRVYNDRGEIQLKARLDGAVQPGVVAATLNWAKLGPGFRNVNVLTSEKLSDLGNSATFYSVLVEVEKS